MDRNQAEAQYVDARLENIRRGYNTLAARIRTMLRTQANDERRLSAAREEVLEFGHEVHLVRTTTFSVVCTKNITYHFRTLMSFRIMNYESASQVSQAW